MIFGEDDMMSDGRSSSAGRSHVEAIQSAGEANRYRPDDRRRWFGVGSTGGIAALFGLGILLADGSIQLVEPAEPPSLTTFDVSVEDQPAISQIAPPPPRPPARPNMAQPAEKPAAAVSVAAAAAIPTAAATPPSPENHIASPPTVAPASLTPAPPPVPQPPQQTRSDTPDTWEGRILAKLNANRRYPRAALMRRYQGVPLIRMVIDRNGSVLSVRLEKSSRIPDLDREALALPKRAQPLPPPPESKEGTSFELVVPIEFHISP